MERAIALQGEVTIRRAHELKDLLCSKLPDTDRLLIDMSGVTEIDLSGLQLFCSAHQTFAKRGGQLRLKGVPAESVRSAIEISGFIREQSCPPDQNGHCLWAPS